MKPFFLFCLSLFLLTTPVNASETIAAVVNDDVVTVSELEARINLAIQSSGLPDNKGVRAQLKDRVLDQLIEESLQLQEAERLDVSVPTDAIKERMNAVAQQNNMSLEQFTGAMRATNVDPSTLARQMKAQLAWGEIVKARIRPQINITETDVELEIQQLQSNAGKMEYLLAEIFIPVEDERNDTKAKTLSKQLYNQLRAGEASFPQLAQQFSQSAGATRGGIIGWVQEGQMPENVDTALREMEVKTVSPPIRSENGYHIVLVQDKRVIDIDENENVAEAEITNQIGNERLEMRARKYLEDLKAKAFIERRV